MIFNLMKPVPTTESATMYLYGHEADKTVSYNGVVFADYPTWDKQTYPYACIIGRTSTHDGTDKYFTFAYFVVSTEPLYYLKEKENIISNKVSLYAKADLSYEEFYYDKSADEHYYNPAWYVRTEKTDIQQGGTVKSSTTIGDILWSNYDVLNYSDDSLVLSASDPVTTYENADVTIDGVGYVGAVLPKLPEWEGERYKEAYSSSNPQNLEKWNKSDFPYAYIGASGSYDRYYLYLSTKPFVVRSSDYRGTTVGDSHIACYLARPSFDDWAFDGSFGTTTDVFGGTTPPIWSNHNILLEDETLHLTASTPVPVYE